LIVGNPAKKIKAVTDEIVKWKTEGTELYRQLPKAMFDTWKECEPLREIPKDLKIQSTGYKTWNESR